jgi:5-formyltetrahydrofolate cyclo-ligase
MTPSKAELRRRLRSACRALARSALQRRSRAICECVEALPLFEHSRALGLYSPMLERGEVDVRPLFRRACAVGKRVYFPFIDRLGGRVDQGFRRVDDLGELAPRGFPFAEPDPCAVRARRGDLDLLIVPALAATAAGDRLGRGSAFYDAVLPDFWPPARSLLVIFSFQLLTELPVEPHDRRCDLVVTDQHLLDPRGVCDEMI